MAIIMTPPATPPRATGLGVADGRRSSDRSSVEQIAKKALQTRSVSVERLDDTFAPSFRLQPSADYFYLLRRAPFSSLRLLRSEQNRLAKEALALQTLRSGSDVCVPRLIDSRSDFLIAGPFRGVSLSSIEPSLSRPARATIYTSIGQHLRCLSRTTGPAFGPVAPTRSFPPSPSWSKCFALLLETLLLDAEDGLVSLPYAFIRSRPRAHAASLDQVARPQLLFLDLSARHSVLVDPASHAVAAVCDFSTAFWGDPYLCDFFCAEASSQSCAEGFGSAVGRPSADQRVRQDLYTLYHALAALLRLCYRPTEVGDEMAARRNLSAALERLGGASG